jgi:glycosyltransferase involved in cell wall biosynthesis
MFVSVVIPTYNRKDSLSETLASLSQQTWPANRFEVIIVDDGSTDGTADVIREPLSFAVQYHYQSNQGGVTARNLGAQHSNGNLLIFLDDDIIVEPEFISSLVQEHETYDRVIAMGTFRPSLTSQDTPFRALYARLASTGNDDMTDGFVSFTECVSNNLSIERDAFFALGMWQNIVTGGGGWWADVDFGYRAHLQGFCFRRSPTAICYHNDYAINDLATACRRLEAVAQYAVALFRKHPHLEPHIPMFQDKGYISWRKDPPRLICRKLARQIASTRPALWGMEQIVSVLEQLYPSPILLHSLYRWIIGGYIFRGYRQGLRECEGH